MTVIVGPEALMPATAVELTQYSNLWTYIRAAPSANGGTGIQVGPSGAFSNFTGGGASSSNGGVACRLDHPLSEQWAQMTLGPTQTAVNTGIALILRGATNGSYISLEIRGTGYAGIAASNAGAAPAVVNANPSSVTGLTFAQGDVIRFELQQVAGVWVPRALRALAAAPTNFQALFTPGAWNATGTTWLAATASGGAAGIGMFQGAATLSYVHTFSAGDFATGPLPPTPPSTSRGAFTIRTTS